MFSIRDAKAKCVVDLDVEEMEEMDDSEIVDYIEEQLGVRLYTKHEVQKCIDGASSDGERGYTDNIISDYV